MNMLLNFFLAHFTFFKILSQVLSSAFKFFLYFPGNVSFYSFRPKGVIEVKSGVEIPTVFVEEEKYGVLEEKILQVH